MRDLHFANPSWFHALWLVIAVVALLFWLDGRGRATLDRFLSRGMQQRLARSIPPLRRWLSFLLIGCAAAMLVVALMRPQWGLTYRRMPRIGAQLMICLDVSKSMLAEDTAPNRLERAKVEIADLLSFLDGDQIGLIAFAGKATVLCPLTPDFGFFRLILDDVGPYSVGRGGTKLEEPIRKALEGFRTESDVQRVILLVTDGEDHDSFPLEAAKLAAERGIKIIAIGFGDEAGSKIQITDPRSGVKSFLRDNAGQEVTTRLDGEMLRDIVQITDGIYVPAGTGTLDLASIYDAHIAPLTRGKLDDRGQAVRREGFQWAILLALIFLVAAVTVRSGAGVTEAAVATAGTSGVAKSSIAAGILVALMAPAGLSTQPTMLAAAQPPPKQKETQPPAKQEAENTDTAAPAQQSDGQADETANPRATFNDGLAYLDSDLDRADRLFTTARRASGTDGEVRFRSTYNMGWVEVKRADSLLEEEPAQALVHLQAAADWFRDAVRLRPDHQDARHNLEIVLRRAMELADSLREKESGDLAQRLDKLIDAERQLVSQASQVVVRVAAEDDPNAADQFRSDFRRLAVEQRKNLSDSQALAKSAGEELSALEANKDDQLEPQQRMRSAQLSNVLHYVNRANQKMGQARSQMRRRQGERAFRRAAASLDELKRARDQLRHPAEVLGLILRDAIEVAKVTMVMAAASRDVPIPERPPHELPAWLTSAFVRQSHQSVAERCEELVAWLRLGLEQETEPPEAGQDAAQNQNPEEQELLERIREALPFVEQGSAALTRANEPLAIEQFDEANRHQADGIRALQEARERLLDLKGLIELTYADQRALTALVAPAENQAAAEDEPDIAQLVQSRQSKNVSRADRLRTMLDTEQQKLDNQPAAGGPAVGQEEAEAERQRLLLAHQLLDQAQAKMQQVIQSYQQAESVEPTEQADAAAKVDQDTTAEKDTGSATDEKDEQDRQTQQHPQAAAHAASKQADEYLQSLRRLFFSVVEHLRETAQRQAQLNDETEQAATLAADEQDLPKRFGPLVPRQAELENISGQIAEALQQQAEQNPAATAGQQNPNFDQQKQMAEITQKLSQAAALVTEGQAEMQLAADQLDSEQPEAESARTHQDAALQKLAEALALLVPPQPQNQQQDPQQQQQQESPQQQQPDPSAQDQSQTDPSRLLQAVRDREARRRRDKQKQRRTQQQAIDKDW